MHDSFSYCLNERLRELEKNFSFEQYNGIGDKPFLIEEGKGCIMLSAPHAVNQLRNGNIKAADRYTGAIALYLHELTGCHLIYSARYFGGDPNYDPVEQNEYQRALKAYIESNDIRFLIDLHGAAESREYAIEIGTAPKTNERGEIVGDIDPSLHQYKFIAELIKNHFEARFTKLWEDKCYVWKNRIFNAGSQNTVTKYITENTNAAGVQLEINRVYRKLDEPERIATLVVGIKELIDELESIGWDNE